MVTGRGHAEGLRRGRCSDGRLGVRSRPDRQAVCLLVQSGAQCIMTSPTTQNVRLTISVTPEVHEVFKRFSAAAGMSLSKAMGEWLGDTVEAAEFTASKMEQARAAPKIVMREMHAYALGIVDETTNLMDDIKEKGRQARARTVSAARPATGKVGPPSGNTGGKGTATRQATGGKGS